MMKISNEDLYKINKNEYQAQQESTLDDAIEMGLTQDEFKLICNKISSAPLLSNKYLNRRYIWKNILVLV